MAMQYQVTVAQTFARLSSVTRALGTLTTKCLTAIPLVETESSSAKRLVMTATNSLVMVAMRTVKWKLALNACKMKNSATLCVMNYAATA